MGTGTSATPTNRQATNAASARLAPASMAYQCTAWASMPTATGQPISCQRIEK